MFKSKLTLATIGLVFLIMLSIVYASNDNDVQDVQETVPDSVDQIIPANNLDIIEN